MTEDFPIMIYHNPACGTSRNVVEMVRAADYSPTIIEYLKAGWTDADLRRLMTAMALRPREFMREKGTPAAELGLLDPAVDDDQILAAMVSHPILVNRPIVVTPKGAKLCRPSERVLELLDRQPAQFTKEDGEVVIPDHGH